MTNKILATSEYNFDKLKDTLDALSKKITTSSALNDILAEANSAFKKFYLDIANPEFSPVYLNAHDTPRSVEYNKNFELILSDITRIYRQLESLADSQIKSYNYGQVVNQEITYRANQLASTVLDLKILSDFTRGDVIVAGDDFKTLEQVDQNIATASPRAEKLFQSGGMGLKRAANEPVVNENTTVEIFPIGPTKNGTAVNTSPTAGNIERFYEGQYYNFIGQARPEGGRFNIKYMMKPGASTSPFPDQSPGELSQVGFFVEIGASEEEKKLARLNMFDGSSDSFWECEYVYDVPTPLLDSIIDTGVLEQDTGNEAFKNKDDTIRGVSTVIDFKKAEDAARKFDFEGRDLTIELVVTLDRPQIVNMVVLDPILFGIKSWPIVAEVATAIAEGEFLPIGDLDSLSYGKILTPEVNKLLNNNEVNQLLAPSRFEYSGKGVFPFAAREASKIRIRLRLESPVPAVYERYVIMLANQISVSGTKTVTTKKGLFR